MADNNPLGSNQFDRYLDPSAVVTPPMQAPVFNGWENKTGKALGLVSSFIAGIGKGRAQKSATDEMMKSRRLEQYNNTAQAIVMNPDIPEDQKTAFIQEYQSALTPVMAGAAKGSEKGSFGHTFVSLLGGMAGGESKGAKYSFEKLDDVMAKYSHLGLGVGGSSISGQIQQAQEGIVKRTNELQKQLGHLPLQTDLAQDPQIQQYSTQIMRHGKSAQYGEKWLTEFQNRFPKETDADVQKDARNSDVDAALRGGQQAPPSAPPTAPAARSAASAVVPGSGQPPPMPAGRTDWATRPEAVAASNQQAPPVAKPAGMITPGNMDLDNRPVVNNADGTHSTVRTITIEEDGKTILIPTVVNGKVVSDDEAIKQFHKTGQHMGIFSSEDAAEAYDAKLHTEKGWDGAPGSTQSQWQASGGQTPPTAKPQAFTAPAGSPIVRKVQEDSAKEPKPIYGKDGKVIGEGIYFQGYTAKGGGSIPAGFYATNEDGSMTRLDGTTAKPKEPELRETGKGFEWMSADGKVTPVVDPETGKQMKGKETKGGRVVDERTGLVYTIGSDGKTEPAYLPDGKTQLRGRTAKTDAAAGDKAYLTQTLSNDRLLDRETKRINDQIRAETNNLNDQTKTQNPDQKKSREENIARLQSELGQVKQRHDEAQSAINDTFNKKAPPNHEDKTEHLLNIIDDDGANDKIGL